MRFSLSKTLKTVRSQLADIHATLHKKISPLWCKHKRERHGVKCNKPLKIGLLQGVLASPGRFELPASRLGGVRSIQLSYGDVCKKYSILQSIWIRTICRLGGDRSIRLNCGDRKMRADCAGNDVIVPVWNFSVNEEKS